MDVMKDCLTEETEKNDKTETNDKTNKTKKNNKNNQTKNEETRRSRILVSLIMLYSMVDKLKSSTTTREVRSLSKLSDKIRTIIPDLESGLKSPAYLMQLKESLREIDDQIYEITSVFK